MQNLMRGFVLRDYDRYSHHDLDTFRRNAMMRGNKNIVEDIPLGKKDLHI